MLFEFASEIEKIGEFQLRMPQVCEIVRTANESSINIGHNILMLLCSYSPQLLLKNL